jgi:hypothetical protein
MIRLLQWLVFILLVIPIIILAFALWALFIVAYTFDALFFEHNMKPQWTKTGRTFTWMMDQLGNFVDWIHPLNKSGDKTL